jgi:DNA-binding MarR family transcriptional regulator
MGKRSLRLTNKEKEILAIIKNNPEGIALPEIAYLMGEDFATIIPEARRLSEKRLIKKKNTNTFLPGSQ